VVTAPNSQLSQLGWSDSHLSRFSLPHAEMKYSVFVRELPFPPCAGDGWDPEEAGGGRSSVGVRTGGRGGILARGSMTGFL